MINLTDNNNEDARILIIIFFFTSLGFQTIRAI